MCHGRNRWAVGGGTAGIDASDSDRRFQGTRSIWNRAALARWVFGI